VKLFCFSWALGSFIVHVVAHALSISSFSNVLKWQIEVSSQESSWNLHFTWEARTIWMYT